MMVARNPEAQVLEDDIAEFGEGFEKPVVRRAKSLPIRNATKDKPAWRVRNMEPKHTGVQFRFSESQLKLLQMAKADQEISIQKILENIVWPVLEQQYGVTETDFPT